MTTEPAPGHRAGVPVRTRIAVAVAALTAVALATTGLVVWVLLSARTDERVHALVDQEIDEFVAFQELGDPTDGRPYASVDALVERFLENNIGSSSELLVGWWDGRWQKRSFSSRGELVDDPAFSGAVQDRVVDGGATTVDTSLGEVYVDVQPVTDGSTNGAFAVAFFTDDEQAPLNRTMRTYAVAAALALLVVTAVAAWVAGRLLAPVRALRATAEEIGETDLARRLPVTGNDDLTDLARTFNAMLDRLDRAFAGQRAFLDDAGHELRTPLTILRGHLELLDEGDPDDVARTRALLLDETDRMSRLVDDLILLTKADRPDFVHASEVYVAGLTDAVADKVRALGNRHWVVDGRAETLFVLDEHRVTQALVQLAHNAVKHTKAGDTVAVGSAVADDGTLSLWVRDTGPGVPPSQRERVFGRFVRVDEDRSGQEGFGLGLSIVAAIAEAHGGRARVEDADPPGARFVLELPPRRHPRSAPWPAS